jgi:hypothetical protein
VVVAVAVVVVVFYVFMAVVIAVVLFNVFVSSWVLATALVLCSRYLRKGHGRVSLS